MTLRIKESLRGNARVLHLSGLMDEPAAGELAERILPKEKPQPIIVDLSGVRVINSMGIGVLIHSARMLEEEGACLVVAKPTSHVRHTLGLTTFDRFAPIVDSVDEALTLVEKAQHPADDSP